MDSAQKPMGMPSPPPGADAAPPLPSALASATIASAREDFRPRLGLQISPSLRPIGLVALTLASFLSGCGQANGSSTTFTEPKNGKDAGEDAAGGGGGSPDTGASGEGGRLADASPSQDARDSADIGRSPDAGAGGDPGCARHWIREACPIVAATAGASTQTAIQDGALLMNETLCPFVCGAVNAPDLPLKLWQEDLTGDFDVEVSFEGFSPSGYGAAFHAFVQDGATDKETADVAIAGTSSSLELRVTITHGGTLQQDPLHASSCSGSLRLRRRAALLTVTAKAGVDEKSISSVFSVNPLRVGLGIQGPYDPTDPPATSHVRVVNFSVSGGGGTIVSDTFDCDSIL